MGLGTRALAFLLFLLGTGMNAWAENPRLFIIYSYAPNVWTKDLRAGLLKKPPLNAMPLQEYYFDSDYWLKRGKLTEAKDAKLEEFVGQIKGSDLVIVADDEAASLVLPKLSSTQSVLLVGINGSSNASAWESFCAAQSSHAILFEEYPYSAALKFAKSRFPKIEKINAIGGDAETTRLMIDGLKTAIAGNKLKLAEEVSARDWSTWRDKLNAWNSPKNLSWFFVPFGLRDAMNEEISPSLVSKWISEHTSNVSIGAIALRDGMDVTVGLSAVDLGAEANVLATQLLSGRSVKCRNPSQSYKIEQGGRKR